MALVDVRWWRVEKRLVGAPRAHRLDHSVIHLKNHTFGTILAPLFLVFALEDGKSIHNIAHCVTRGCEAVFQPLFINSILLWAMAPIAIDFAWQIEMKECRV